MRIELKRSPITGELEIDDWTMASAARSLLHIPRKRLYDIKNKKYKLFVIIKIKVIYLSA